MGFEALPVRQMGQIDGRTSVCRFLHFAFQEGCGFYFMAVKTHSAADGLCVYLGRSISRLSFVNVRPNQVTVQVAAVWADSNKIRHAYGNSLVMVLH